MRNKYKNLLIIGVVVFALLYLPASNAYASWFDIGNIATNAIGNVFYWLSFALSTIGGVLFSFAAFLVNFAMQLNLNVLAEETNKLAVTGWTITRDIANLGFVLVIIIIAFLTILRLSEYGNQKMLFRLIAAAILVNFSFAIAGVFIDFSNTVTYFFLNKISPGANVFGLADSLAGAFNPQGLYGSASAYQGEESNVFSVVLTGIQSLVFVTVFTLAGAFTLLAIAAMFFLRYLHLTFLVIVAPIVWLFWVVPQLAGQFGKWWNSFFRWTFFAPASMFFVYLALLSARGMGKQNKDYISAGSGIFGSMSDILKNVLDKGAQMVVLIGILIGGLIIADQMGIGMAKGALGVLSGVQKGFAGWAGRQTGKLGSLPLRTGVGRNITQGLQALGATSKNRVVRALGRPFREVGTAISKARVSAEKQNVDAGKKATEGLSYLEMGRRYGSADNPQKMVIWMNLIEARKEQRKKIDNPKATDEERAEATKIRDQISEAMSNLPSTAKEDVETYKALYGEHEEPPKYKAKKSKSKKDDKKKGEGKGGEEEEDDEDDEE